MPAGGSTADWMRKRLENEAKGSAGQPVSAHGRTMPTQGDSANNGFKSVNSQGQPNQGQSTPASKLRGHGKSKTELSPNNTKKAGSSTKGKAGYKQPSKEAIHRRLFNAAPVAEVGNVNKSQGAGRTGILSNFEGFSKGQ